MAPGDCFDVVQAEIDKLLTQARGNRFKAVNLGFQRMWASGLITDRGVERLGKVNLAIIGAEQGKHAPADVVARLDRLYLDALADPEGSAVGMTMIGVAHSARTNQIAILAG